MNVSKGKFNKSLATGICISLLILVVFSFLYAGRTVGNQSTSALYPLAKFSGQVKVGDGEWMPYVKGQHIPSTKGDVTLKGQFHLISPENGEDLGVLQSGTPISLYMNHIGGYIIEDDGEKHTVDTELPLAGEDMCGRMIIGYDYKGGKDVVIHLTNPHKFGNEYAVDEFLNNLSVYGGTNYEKDILAEGSIQRNLGITLILCAFIVLGAALFSVLIHMKGSRNLWLIGFTILCAGFYFIYSADGVMFFSEIVKFNTRILGASIILYMFTVTVFLAFLLTGIKKRFGGILILVSVISNIIVLLIPNLTDIKFYDTLGIWALIQSIICICMTALLANQFSAGEKNNEMICAFGMLPMIAFVLDVLGTRFQWWNGGVVSEIVFIVLFVLSLVLLLRIIPKNINASAVAKEFEAEKNILKAELAESRIATMISQIQPHFIYNTLGTIEQLCISDPESASKLVRNFSLYLRGNFSELNNTKPIRFSQEMSHVKHYTDIEQVRFPDMTIQYDLRSVEFVLPALSVQPLVENAIKHGLMGLEEGGIVMISAYETDTHYVVEVTDDGVGFDTELEYDQIKHVGIKNIRGRIEAMCNGTLTIESEPGHGTKATLSIPKEAGEYDSNNG